MNTATARAIAHAFSSIASFSDTTGRPLRQYQSDVAAAVIHSVKAREGKTFTIMFGRQMGKNETSAQIEAYLMALFAKQGGTIVKAAPSFKPQIVNSILRLKTTLDESPLTRHRWHPQFGYMIALGKATTTFLSADAKANVVGATASLLLEIDEAQGVNPDKYDRDFRPMASSTNATTVLYGTAWSEDSLLHRQKLHNLELQQRTGQQLHFEYDWHALARINPHYNAYVRSEIDRLGWEHPSIQTQYRLISLADAGRLFSMEQRAKLRGTHDRETEPQDGRSYVAGIDIAGEDENAEDAVARALVPKKDSTVVTIAELGRDTMGQGTAKVVDFAWWTGRDPHEQQEALLTYLGHWRPSKIVVDATGIGSATASFLTARFGEARVEEFVFTAPKKSELGYDMLAAINTDRLQLYASDPNDPESRQCWWEIEHCRYELKSNDIIRWYVPPSEGHDDFVVSLALCSRAAAQSFPAVASGLIRNKPSDDELSAW